MEILLRIDYGTTIIFTCETLLKSIAYGFLFINKKSYLRSTTNILDFIIVISSIFSLFPTHSGFGVILGKIKIFRLFRIMRPLRIISRSESFRITIESLLKSIP